MVSRTKYKKMERFVKTTLQRSLLAALTASIACISSIAPVNAGYDNTADADAAIYVMFTQGAANSIYVGQVRRAGKTVEDQVKARVAEHLKNDQDKPWTNGSGTWNWDIVSYGSWTELETSANEQAWMMHYCFTKNFTLINARNELSQAKWNQYANAGTYDAKNLVGNIVQSNGNIKLVDVASCLTK